jgi:uncharacterized membrane protein YphA (DoxX/SURF4 family)
LQGPIQKIVFWTAANIFQLRQPLIYTGSGSGDKTFDWVLAFCILIVAVIAAAVWSILDRRRENYTALHKWFRVFMRFGLASQMLLYGFLKAVPLQMPFPSLAKLIEPFGNFSPMGVLWWSVGASPAYEIFTGCAELLGGLLLVIPGTTMFGALVCLADTTQVFALNMTYDVPVKLLSFHLILLSLFLLAPDVRRLIGFFFLNRPVAPSAAPGLFSTRLGNRIALTVQVGLGLWLVGTHAFGAWIQWHSYGGGRIVPPIYGIWDVEQMSVDGEIRPPLVTDNDRWRRMIVDFPTFIGFQRMDNSVINYQATIDYSAKGRIFLPQGILAFQRPAPGRLVLDGSMSGRKIHMELELVDRDKFLLVSRGFHWIQEYPFNR